MESRTLRITTFAVLAHIAYTTAFTKCLPCGRPNLGYRSHQGFRRARSGIRTSNQPLFRESLRLGFLFRKWFAPGRIGPTACYNTSRWGGFLRRCTGEPAKHRGKREPRLQTQKASIARTASRKRSRIGLRIGSAQIVISDLLLLRCDARGEPAEIGLKQAHEGSLPRRFRKHRSSFFRSRVLSAEAEAKIKGEALFERGPSWAKMRFFVQGASLLIHPLFHSLTRTLHSNGSVELQIHVYGSGTRVFAFNIANPDFFDLIHCNSSLPFLPSRLRSDR